MKVLFLKPSGSHTVGQVADVAEGYAQNYLIPQQLEVPATTHVLRQSHATLEASQAAAASAEQRTDALAAALNQATVRIPAKAASSGKLYASVTPAMIAAAIAKQFGTPVPSALVPALPTLKRAGRHPVTLHIRAATVTFTLDV
jgi:large subunit ribosomal protein L9